MFDSDIAINELQLGLFARIVADLPESSLFQPSPGHGHAPVWVLGHLAVTGEFGGRLLGATPAHPEWGTLFGPGSSGQVAESPALTRDVLADAVRDAYRTLRERAVQADPELVARPHQVGFFEGTPIRTVGHVVSLLLTNHFGFHLSQLSSCRRAAGFPALF